MINFNIKKSKILKEKRNNFAYIDGANLDKGINDLGWTLDYRRFRVWLFEKYGISQAYIFIGMISKYKNLYKYLQESGFTLAFKEVVYDGAGRPKGNCDADFVLQLVRDVYDNRFDRAVVVSSDGDYAGLIKFLMEKGKLEIILSPNNQKKCSILLKRTNAKISYINDQRSILEIKKEKTPDTDGTV